MNFLALEPLLIVRLRSRIPAARAVLSAADLADVRQATQVTPALHVLYGGYRPVEAAGRGAVVRLVQTWYVVAVVRNVAQGDAAQRVREDACALLDPVLAALIGWAPEHGGAHIGPLQLVAAPAPLIEAGYGYFPLAFTAELHLQGVSA